jgi:serine/threonine protein kinase
MLCREALIWRYLDHPSVLDFYGIDNLTVPGPNGTSYCLVSPFLENGTILQFRETRGPENMNMLQLVCRHSL